MKLDSAILAGGKGERLFATVCSQAALFAEAKRVCEEIRPLPAYH